MSRYINWLVLHLGILVVGIAVPYQACAMGGLFMGRLSATMAKVIHKRFCATSAKQRAEQAMFEKSWYDHEGLPAFAPKSYEQLRKNALELHDYWSKHYDAIDKKITEALQGASVLQQEVGLLPAERMRAKKCQSNAKILSRGLDAAWLAKERAYNNYLAVQNKIDRAAQPGFFHRLMKSLKNSFGFNSR